MMWHRMLLVATIAAGLASGAGTISAAASSVPVGAAAPTFQVTGNEPWALAGLMPGDALPEREVRITATGCVRYWLAPSLSGDEALGAWLEVRATSAADHSTLASGRVGDFAEAAAEPQARTLCNGEEVVRLSGVLHRDATNEVQGASGNLTWTVYAVEAAAPNR